MSHFTKNFLCRSCRTSSIHINKEIIRNKSTAPLFIYPCLFEILFTRIFQVCNSPIPFKRIILLKMVTRVYVLIPHECLAWMILWASQSCNHSLLFIPVFFLSIPIHSMFRYFPFILYRTSSSPCLTWNCETFPWYPCLPWTILPTCPSNWILLWSRWS